MTMQERTGLSKKTIWKYARVPANGIRPRMRAVEGIWKVKLITVIFHI